VIVAVAEAVTMASLMHHDARTALLDTVLLAVVSAPFLYLWVVRPEARRALEAARRAGDERLRTLLDSVVEAVLVVDEEGAILQANPTADALFGYDSGEPVGKPYDILVPERFRASHAIDTFARAVRRALGASDGAGVLRAQR